MIIINDDEKQYVYIYNGSNQMTHMLSALPNAKSSDAAWQIKEFTYDVNGNMTHRKFPRNSNGIASAAYAFVADNYASYSYGPA